MEKAAQMLTVQMLVGFEACLPARRAFEIRFGTKASIANVLAWLRKIGEKEWEGWILAQTPELTAAFLLHGADVHDGHALIEASRQGRIDVARLLLASGANVYAANSEALCEAVAQGHIDVVRLLLASGADMLTLMTMLLLVGGQEWDGLTWQNP